MQTGAWRRESENLVSTRRVVAPIGGGVGGASGRGLDGREGGGVSGEGCVLGLGFGWCCVWSVKFYEYMMGWDKRDNLY
jgi:hypothetical protein